MTLVHRENGWDVAAFVLRTFLTTCAAIILVLQANGYLIDFEHLRIAKSGLLVTTKEPANAQTVVDGKASIGSDKKTSMQLMPGSYQVVVTAEGYQSWQKLVRIDPGKATVLENLFLFRTIAGPLESVVHSATFETLPLVSPKLRIENGEVWLAGSPEERLVTRLAVPVEQALLFDEGHVIFLAGGAVRVIDSDGSNDKVLFQVEPNEPVRLFRDQNTHYLGVAMQSGTYRRLVR